MLMSIPRRCSLPSSFALALFLYLFHAVAVANGYFHRKTFSHYRNGVDHAESSPASGEAVGSLAVAGDGEQKSAGIVRRSKQSAAESEAVTGANTEARNTALRTMIFDGRGNPLLADGMISAWDGIAMVDPVHRSEVLAGGEGDGVETLRSEDLTLSTGRVVVPAESSIESTGPKVLAIAKVVSAPTIATTRPIAVSRIPSSSRPHHTTPHHTTPHHITPLTRRPLRLRRRVDGAAPEGVGGFSIQ